MSKIRGYAIFHRHGHRAPSGNIMSEASRSVESSMWTDLVNDGRDSFISAAASYPIKNNDGRGASHDAATFPFGQLTARGAHHLMDVGDKISMSFPLIRTVPSTNIEAYSTNYDRTKVRMRIFYCERKFELSGVRSTFNCGTVCYYISLWCEVCDV